MKKLIHEFRLAVFYDLMLIAIKILPKECKKTVIWMSQIPMEP